MSSSRQELDYKGAWNCVGDCLLCVNKVRRFQPHSGKRLTK